MLTIARSFVDTWFYVHNAGSGNVFNQAVRVVTPTPAHSLRKAPSSSSPPPFASSTPSSTNTGFVGSATPGVAGPRQSSIVSINGNGFGPLSISRSSPLGSRVPPWKKTSFPKSSVHNHIERFGRKWQSPMHCTPRHDSQCLERGTDAPTRPRSFRSQNSSQRTKPTEMVTPDGNTLTLGALAAVELPGGGSPVKLHTPLSRSQHFHSDESSKVPDDQEQEPISTASNGTDDDVLAATRRYTVRGCLPCSWPDCAQL